MKSLSKAIILGASGFVGSALTSELIENDYEVLAIHNSRNLSLTKDIEVERLWKLKHNSLGPESISEVVKRAGWETGDSCLFFNCSWSSHGSLATGGIQVQLENAALAFMAVEESKKLGCKKYISLGTELTRSWRENGSPELSRLPKDFENYALAKLASSDFTRLSGYLSKVDISFASFSSPLGQGVRQNSYILSSLRAIKNGVPFELPRNREAQNFISVSELARGLRLVGELGEPGVEYRLLGPSSATLPDLFQALQKSFCSDSLGKFLETELVTSSSDIDAVEREIGFKADKNLAKILDEVGML